MNESKMKITAIEAKLRAKMAEQDFVNVNQLRNWICQIQHVAPRNNIYLGVTFEKLHLVIDEIEKTERAV